MKKLLIILYIILIISELSYSQCPNGISFYNQVAIDNFASSGCTHINGPLTIQAGFGGDITNLDGLSSITSISGDLQINMNSKLKNLNGLRNLTIVGNDVRLYYNVSLKDLSGLNNIQTIGGNLTLDHNDSLYSIAEFANLKSIGGDLSITGTNPVKSLNGLNSIKNLSGSLAIVSYYGLENLQGLNSLKTIGKNIHIDGVKTLDGLDSLISINGGLTIKNSGITSLANISNISGITVLYLEGNQNLSSCSIKSICDFLSITTNYASINNNSIGCNDRSQILNGCVVTGLNEKAKSKVLSFYPNPTYNMLHLTETSNYTITDMTGQILFKDKGSEISLSGLKAGLYYITINGRTEKFVKE